MIEMTNPKIWISNTNVKKQGAVLKKEQSYFIKKKSVLNNIYQGFPGEQQSDYCLAELFFYKSPLCSQSRLCERMLNEKDKCNGYPLLHRILYILSQKHKVILKYY